MVVVQQPRQSGVYFLKDGEGRIKIGWSVEVPRRLRQLQTAQAQLLVCLGVIWTTDPETEKRLHRQFAALKIRGEWFDGKCGTIERYILTVTNHVQAKIAQEP